MRKLREMVAVQFSLEPLIRRSAPPSPYVRRAVTGKLVSHRLLLWGEGPRSGDEGFGII